MQEPAISHTWKRAASITGVSTRTLRRRIAVGELKARRMGGLIIIEDRELVRFIQNCPDAKPLAKTA